MRFLIFLSAFVGAPAFAACPNLTGTFNCTDGSAGSVQQKFSTSVQNGATVYNINGIQVIADGQSYPTPSELMANGKYVATCSGDNQVLIHAEGPFAWGSSSGYLKLDISTYLVGTQIEIGDHVDFLPVSGPEKTQDANLTCTPAN